MYNYVFGNYVFVLEKIKNGGGKKWHSGEEKIHHET